jgi:hypothetical protein
MVRSLSTAVMATSAFVLACTLLSVLVLGEELPREESPASAHPLSDEEANRV